MAIAESASLALSSPLLVVPGVGRFAHVVRELRASGFADAIQDRVASGRAVLAICSGMHAMCEGSDEDPDAVGLSLLPGRATYMGCSGGPRIGWFRLRPKDTSQNLLVPDHPYYFAHSYGLASGPFTTHVLNSHSSGNVSAVVQVGTLLALQFHPEKSQVAGAELLSRIAAWARSL